MKRLTIAWQSLRASFWFIPALIVLGSLAAGAALVEFDAWKTDELAAWSPRLFGASAAGSWAMLSAIATSMITVAGVVFSITLVALSLTSTQYSPRVLRNFMRDGPTQVVLGTFLGIFAYCLVVLRTIRGGDDANYIPSLAVLGGMGYALAGIALLIYFIHHMATSIQAASILERIAADTAAAIDHLFPDRQADEDCADVAPPQLPQEWTLITARRSGYLVTVDTDELIKQARDGERVLRLCASVGDFVAQGAPLLAVEGTAPLPAGRADRLHGCVQLGHQRTVEQDASFGLQQLVDVGLKALSPGINDPTTACMCIDRLGDLLARLAGRRIPGPHRMSNGRLRLVVPAPDLCAWIDQSLTPLVAHSRGNPQVLDKAFDACRLIAVRGPLRRRRADLSPVLRQLRMELRLVRPAARSMPLRRRLREFERAELGWDHQEPTTPPT